jgi:hypothetical protein
MPFLAVLFTLLQQLGSLLLRAWPAIVGVCGCVWFGAHGQFAEAAAALTGGLCGYQVLHQTKPAKTP